MTTTFCTDYESVNPALFWHFSFQANKINIAMDPSTILAPSHHYSKGPFICCLLRRVASIHQTLGAELKSLKQIDECFFYTMLVGYKCHIDRIW